MRLFSLTTVSLGLAFGVSAYVVAMALLTLPPVQRNAFYAHKANPTYFQDLSNVEQFGFLQHQVQQFTLTTPDGVTLHAWHILPTHVYLEHEQALKSQENFGIKDADQVLETAGMKLLLEHPNAHVVLSFHGNAAHLASGQRPATYQQMLGLSTPQRPIHVVAFDYRGFGLSTGHPTEEGVTTDGITMASFLTGYSPAAAAPKTQQRIHPSRILLVGQSLGTATSTALYHRWTLMHHLPPFRGLVLMASFSSVPTLLYSYSIKGLSPPTLSPLNYFPGVQERLLSTIADTWQTDRRIGELVAADGVGLNLTLLHAKNDGDIPWREGWRNWEAAMAAGRPGKMVEGGEGGDEGLEVREWESQGGEKRVRWERVLYGGHNRVATSEHAKLAVLRILDR